MNQNNNFKNPNTGIKFNEEYSGERPYFPETSGIVSWVINSSGGLVKNAKQANYVLVVVVIVAVSISLFLVFGNEQTVKDDGTNKEYEEYLLSHPGEI